MNKVIRHPLVIGIGWMILIFGCAYLSLFRPGIGTRWTQGPQPPEPIAQLALGKEGEILAYASSGQMYELDYSIGWPTEWIKVNQPSGSSLIGVCSHGNERFIVFPPPGKVKSRVSQTCGILESTFHFELAQTENGEVWMWEHESYAYTELAIMVGLSCGFLASIPIVLTGLGQVFRKLKKTS